MSRGEIQFQYQAADRLGIDPSVLCRWEQNQDRVFGYLEGQKGEGKKGKIKQIHFKESKFKHENDELFERFLYRRTVLGLGIDSYWLRYQMRQVLNEFKTVGYASFKCSNGWLNRWLKRYDVSFQCRTDKKPVSTLARIGPIRDFHQRVQEIQRSGVQRSPQYGRFPPDYIWNCDQIPLPFCLNPKRSYNLKGIPCWVASRGPSGLDKRQASIQLTLRAAGEQLIPPCIIFRGEGQISEDEIHDLDSFSHINWRFQKKAWADGKFCEWHLENMATILHTESPGEHLLVLDNLSAQ